MPTVAITLDLSCGRCRSKIQKILCCIQERCRFVFEKVVYEKEKVVVTGPFDAIELCCKLRCKAGCFVTKIEIVPPPPPKRPPPPPPPSPPPSPPPPPPPPIDDTGKCKKKPRKKPDPAPCDKLVPYPYPYPYPCPYPYQQLACPSSCPTPLRPCCQCYSCKPAPPPCPPPRPVCPPQPVCCPLPPPPCPCPPWTPCQCRGNKRDFCFEDAQPDGPCAVM